MQRRMGANDNTDCEGGEIGMEKAIKCFNGLGENGGIMVAVVSPGGKAADIFTWPVPEGKVQKAELLEEFLNLPYIRPHFLRVIGVKE